MTTTIVVQTNTGCKALSLWNGSSNNAPPPNWNLNSFDDSTWGFAVNNPLQIPGIGGSMAVWAEHPGLNRIEQCLMRQHFTLTSHQIVSASIIIWCTTFAGVWINGAFVPGSHVGAPTTLPVATSMLIGGGANLIAGKGDANDTHLADFHLSWTLTIVLPSGVRLVIAPGGQTVRYGIAPGSRQRLTVTI